LERYVDGKSGAVELELIGAHTQMCDACCGELADLIHVRDVQPSAASAPQTGSRFLVTVAAAITAVFVGV
jgi:hypothetical protein